MAWKENEWTGRKEEKMTTSSAWLSTGKVLRKTTLIICREKRKAMTGKKYRRCMTEFIPTVWGGEISKRLVCLCWEEREEHFYVCVYSGRYTRAECCKQSSSLDFRWCNAGQKSITAVLLCACWTWLCSESCDVMVPVSDFPRGFGYSFVLLRPQFVYSLSGLRIRARVFTP